MHCSTTLPPPGFCNRHVDKMSNGGTGFPYGDRKSTRLNSSHDQISYAVFCLKKKNTNGHVHYEQPIRLMNAGVYVTPLPTVNPTAHIDSAAFLGTINPETNKIPQH